MPKLKKGEDYETEIDVPGTRNDVLEDESVSGCKLLQNAPNSNNTNAAD